MGRDVVENSTERARPRSCARDEAEGVYRMEHEKNGAETSKEESIGELLPRVMETLDGSELSSEQGPYSRRKWSSVGQWGRRSDSGSSAARRRVYFKAVRAAAESVCGQQRRTWISFAVSH